jgi:hypothetical protein
VHRPEKVGVAADAEYQIEHARNHVVILDDVGRAHLAQARAQVVLADARNHLDQQQAAQPRRALVGARANEPTHEADVAHVDAAAMQLAHQSRRRRSAGAPESCTGRRRRRVQVALEQRRGQRRGDGRDTAARQR